MLAQLRKSCFILVQSRFVKLDLRIIRVNCSIHNIEVIECIMNKLREKFKNIEECAEHVGGAY